MEDVRQEGSRIFGEHAAGGIIPFGAALQYGAADGEVVAAVTATTLSCIGIADMDAVEKDNDGFYADGNPIPIITGGPCNVWLTGGEAAVTGNYLKLQTQFGAGTENLGVFMVDGNSRTVLSQAKVIGKNVGSADYDQVITTAASGSKTVTFGSAAIITSLGCAVGDYILLEDDDGAEINRVSAIGTTTITLQNAMVNTYDATPKAYTLKQVLVELI